MRRITMVKDRIHCNVVFTTLLIVPAYVKGESIQGNIHPFRGVST